MSNALTSISALNVYSADSFYLRLRGLLGRRELQMNEALHIRPCSDVHTFGMKYDLDIVFLDSTGSVLKIESLKPNCWAYCKGAKSVLEFKAGCAQQHGYDQEVDEIPSFNEKHLIRKSIGERA